MELRVCVLVRWLTFTRADAQITPRGMVQKAAMLKGGPRSHAERLIEQTRRI